MPPKDPTLASMRVRMPPELHDAVETRAREAGMSMNTWVVRQLSALTADEAPKAAGRRSNQTATYSAEVDFALSGADTDSQAQRLVGQMASMAELAGGDPVGTRIRRTVPIPGAASNSS